MLHKTVNIFQQILSFPLGETVFLKGYLLVKIYPTIESEPKIHSNLRPQWLPGKHYELLVVYAVNSLSEEQETWIRKQFQSMRRNIKNIGNKYLLNESDST